jgi:glycosyltransferase involved in cell wall biosynthesis
MKIAHVCPFYHPAIGGVKQVVEELAKRQVKEGHEVHVFTSDWDKEKRIKIKEEEMDGIKIHRCFHLAKFANFVSFWPTIFQKIITMKFDIVHSHVFGHPHFFLSALASRISGAKHLHTTHCPWTKANRSITGRLGMLLSYNLFSRFSFKITNKIIAITPWEINFIKKYGGAKNKIVVLPNGMSEDFFKKIKNNDFKKKKGISGKMVLFFGRLNITKGPERFVEIAKKILSKEKNVTFVIRGPDEGMREIVKKKIGNEKKIILLDETRDRKEIIKMYQAADIFVLPSFREGLPLTLFEAMAAGLPIVATPVNGIPYEMEDKKNGFLVNYGNDDKFVEKIINLLKNPEKISEISKNNVSKAANYKWDLISKRTLKLYTK